MTISDDKKTITLSVPLGTKLYSYNTNCNNTCYRDSSDNMGGNPTKGLRETEKALGVTCNTDAPCHVLFTGTINETLTLKNFSDILPLLNKKWFLTDKEAREAGIKHVMEHRKIMRDHYVPFGEHSDNLIKTDYLNGVRTPDSIALGRKIDERTAPDYYGEED